LSHFHIIIAGAGCAGLSLLTRLLQSGRFSDKRILLVDKASKTANDRTWCFWEKGEGFFEPIVYKSWDHLWLHAPGYSQLHDIRPYRYKMIRGQDFYQYCFNIIARHKNVTVEYGIIENISSNTVSIGAYYHTADFVFNSILFEKPRLKNNQYYLLQHFKGWVIETTRPAFDPRQATLMDFRINQQGGTSFVYVMPFTETRALVEYTVFSEKLLDDYDKVLEDYIHVDFTIIEVEFGVIPMTNYPFQPADGNTVNIGTAGGQTKASSGYTFRFIQKQSQLLVNNLVQHGTPFPLVKQPRRFRWYDGTLLNILYHNKLPGAYIFTELFKNNRATDVLKFLDNETTVMEEMKIIGVLPKKVFIGAALQQLW
jgi:2-polyprenyl-6-methoxyphenol hydroxylase and related FAD-dependent oxidoreductases